MNKQTINTEHFTDAEFMTAAEKSNVLKAWHRFLRSGFEFRQFTKALYTHLIMHCSFIAHYNRTGFYGTYFKHPEDTERFFDQFDHLKGCVSVEYGMTYWIQGGNDVCAQYYDINNAMVDVLEPYLPEMRKALRARELQDAEVKLATARAKVDTMLGQNSVYSIKRQELLAVREEAFVDYLDVIDGLLQQRHGITWKDTNLDLIKSCHRNGETPQECVEEIATKYDLDRIDCVYVPGKEV